MDIELPSDDEPDDDAVFGGRIDLYEAYWLYVDGVRYVGPVLDQSAATKDDEDRSPLARHYNHFYEKKEEYKEKCRDLPVSLPKYKEHFGEPRGDVRKIPEQELNDLGIDMSEGDDPIWLPPEYELPQVWNNDLENMGVGELREIVKRLRNENKELREELDTLREQLERVRRSLTAYLDSDRSDEDSRSTSSYHCDRCGEIFESRAARNGHKPHCDGSRNSHKNSKTTSSREELANLAQELPAIQEQQSTKNHEGLSSEEELENLNHLLQGSL